MADINSITNMQAGSVYRHNTEEKLSGWINPEKKKSQASHELKGLKLARN